MAGLVQAVAVDLDGTLTCDGRLRPGVSSALAECRAEGVVVVLVTGRIRAELVAEYPDLPEAFDAVVYENGAVVYVDNQIVSVVPPVDRELVDALRRRHVSLRVGEALLACHGADTPAVIEEIARLGLDCQTSHNRTELMVLPPGVSKATGLQAALAEFGVSAHNAIAIGDGENDLSMLSVAEIAVAVANAVPSLRQHADLVLPDTVEAVADFLRGPVVRGQQLVRSPRHAVRIGVAEDGTPVTVPGAQANVLVCGDTGTGKSHLAGLMLERWITAGYTALVVDPEGDYTALGQLRHTVVTDPDGPPSLSRLVQMLHTQSLSVVLDLSGTDPGEARGYLSRVAAGVEATRAVYGLPSWVVVDEAHEPLTAGGPLANVFRPSGGGYCFITYQPDALCAPAITGVELTFTTLGRDPAEPESGPARARLEIAGHEPVVLRVDPRLTRHVRHRHKYLRVALGPEHHFAFRDRSGAVIGIAASVDELLAEIGAVPAETIEHHAVHGDFSRWAIGALRDHDLAVRIAAAENQFTSRLSVETVRLRKRLIADIRDRYHEPIAEPSRLDRLGPAPGAAGAEDG